MSGEFTKQYFEPYVKDFVSTVLLIDDQLEYSEPTSPKSMALVTPSQGSAPLEKANEISGLGVDGGATDRKVYVTELMKNFSKAGLLVTPINPQKLDAQSKIDCIEILLKLAKKADVIILDWDMTVRLTDGQMFSNNDLSVQVINRLNSDKKYRLVIIYTADTESEVKAKLSGAENIEIRVYGKVNTTGNIVKSYEDLSKQIFVDYLSSKNGFLSLILLRALTNLRYSTYSMLDSLKSDYDKSVLCHYLLLCNIGDFQDFCEGLVHDEIFAYLEQCDNSDLVKKEVMKQVLESKAIAYKSKDNQQKNTEEIKQYIESVCSYKSPECKSMTKFLKKNLDESEVKLLKDFSVFVSTIDKNLKPNLHLGCVVKKNEDYYLCVQPGCDSVRIPTIEEIESSPTESQGTKSPKSFLFLKLKKTDEKVDFYIPDGDDFIGFSIHYNQFENYYFSGDVRGFVSLGDDKCYRTYSKEGSPIVFRYSCCLKPMFAQKIANEFAANISRVGIDQFEWLRLKAN